MNTFNGKPAFIVTILILFGIGVWLIINGDIGFGSSLIGATIGVTAVRCIKARKIREMEAKGLPPYDERTIFISDKAARVTLSIAIMLAACIVLVGSILGPEVMVNPYNFLGFCIAILIFIYLIAYYYYSKNN